MYEFLVAEFLQLVCIPCLGVFYVKSITFYAYSHQFQHKEDFLNPLLVKRENFRFMTQHFSIQAKSLAAILCFAEFSFLDFRWP